MCGLYNNNVSMTAMATDFSPSPPILSDLGDLGYKTPCAHDELRVSLFAGACMDSMSMSCLVSKSSMTWSRILKPFITEHVLNAFKQDVMRAVPEVVLRSNYLTVGTVVQTQEDVPGTHWTREHGRLDAAVRMFLKLQVDEEYQTRAVPISYRIAFSLHLRSLRTSCPQLEALCPDDLEKFLARLDPRQCDELANDVERECLRMVLQPPPSPCHCALCSIHSACRSRGT